MGRAKTFISSSPVHVDFGLLVIRAGVGISMAVLHGYGKITGGSDLWARLGGNMEHVGISFAPALWGFMAAFSEFFAAILIVIGLFFRPAALLIAFTMFIAMLSHLNLPADNARAGWKGASHALELMCVFVGLFFTGPGRFSLGHMMTKKRD